MSSPPPPSSPDVSSSTESPQQTLPPPQDVPTNPVEFLKNVDKIPCARNSFLTGIAGGAGMAFIRGMSVAPIVAGHWFAGTFLVLSLGSWQLCQAKIERERQNVARIIESGPKRTLRKAEEGTESSSSSPSEPSSSKS
ncbi:hypothetical protein D9758_002604 [Tetrapyrgos nigripes]|uniref:Cytochrome c oxidase assembly protein COX20, mitochondrial n=1 Tax=Tetrapyrgos nigripes TaxID=182062 RepID=A0A8H5GQB6_9AGAR|nr:hypothetical protein D9758_002604 [Tetrapyrgos nigripes]